jgi:septation ring formation regulator EzrA
MDKMVTTGDLISAIIVISLIIMAATLFIFDKIDARFDALEEKLEEKEKPHD